jgi:very-short-patch-repair endonuclease
MSNKKYNTVTLLPLVRAAVSDHKCRSAEAISRLLGIPSRTILKYIPDLQSIFDEFGVTRVLRGNPSRDYVAMIAKLERCVLERGAWVSKEDLAASVGLTGMGLHGYGIDTNALCARLGFPKPSRKGARPSEFTEEYLAKIRKEYVDYIRSVNRKVTQVEFCEVLGYNPDSIRHNRKSIDVEALHTEAGVPYSKDIRRFTKEDVETACVDYIKSVGRYVESHELRTKTGFSRAAIFGSLGSLRELNASLGHYPSNLGYERLIGMFLQELFPDYTIERQKTFPGLLHKKSLKYDFYVKDIPLLVEVDGAQHYDPENRWYSEEGTVRDGKKNKYAEESGISLVRIPYIFNVNREHIEALLTTAGIPVPDSGSALRGS